MLRTLTSCQRNTSVDLLCCYSCACKWCYMTTYVLRAQPSRSYTSFTYSKTEAKFSSTIAQICLLALALRFSSCALPGRGRRGSGQHVGGHSVTQRAARSGHTRPRRCHYARQNYAQGSSRTHRGAPTVSYDDKGRQTAGCGIVSEHILAQSGR